jgi:hypothetical protein
LLLFVATKLRFAGGSKGSTGLFAISSYANFIATKAIRMYQQCCESVWDNARDELTITSVAALALASSERTLPWQLDSNARWQAPFFRWD